MPSFGALIAVPAMNTVIILVSLAFLMFVAYRGYSVILFAPLAALGAVLATDPGLVAPVFSGLFMEKTAGFIKNFFPIFLLGAIFGKTMELSGFAKSIGGGIIHLFGPRQAIPAVVAVCAALTYGGVSLFVVVFAAYPFAAEIFRQGNIPKRLIPGALALGSLTFTMDALPGTPQIQNIIPTAFFKTDIYAAPVLGVTGGVFILVTGLAYLEWRRRRAVHAGEGYACAAVPVNEPEPVTEGKLPHPVMAMLPLLMVGVVNKVLTGAIPAFYGTAHSFVPSHFGKAGPVVQEIAKMNATWAVEGALIAGIVTVFVFAGRRVAGRFVEGSKAAVAGALLASMNTASEYGFGAVIAYLPGFLAVAEVLKHIPNPLVNEAITVTSLAGITGSASGGLGIALAAMSDTFITAANTAGIPMEVMHRVAVMASGGMDTLPHNGAVITILAVTGLTHRQAYVDIFAVTIIKTVAVFVVIATYYLTGWV